ICLSSTFRATRSGERARFVGLFARMHRAFDGWMLARAPAIHQLKASTTTGDHGPQYFNFLIFVQWLPKLVGAHFVRFVAENAGRG
ncbi:unnamed protein product, partial [Ascophyllum nodosum]